ncbi:CvpA family protein [Fervidibacillus halotolerans]|uniref:CvpA family protein n=1 Tax=Fervidibacillus halotolerans TaxID=2980027 RepID=A0A9E8LYJ3_9BACI|nr:CvpA family protein [Fervidibacillus halotolerans]WAA11630.1 CvpA family protein [Fervidibacillus halotolerans]
MLNVILLILLFMGFIVGLRRGLVLQLIHLTSFFIAFLLAALYYEELALRLSLWIPYPTIGDGTTLQMVLDMVNGEEAFYKGIAFFLIFFVVKILLHIIGSMIDFLANIPIIKQLNGWLGALLGFFEVYLILFVILYILALLPIEYIQDLIRNSSIASGIIEHTPIFSKKLQDMWLN